MRLLRSFAILICITTFYSALHATKVLAEKERSHQTLVRAIPHFEERKFIGFRLLGVYQSNILKQFGFLEGDVLLGINGNQLENGPRALDIGQLLNKLRNGEIQRVELSRGDLEFTKDGTFHLRERSGSNPPSLPFRQTPSPEKKHEQLNPTGTEKLSTSVTKKKNLVNGNIFVLGMLVAIIILTLLWLKLRRHLSSPLIRIAVFAYLVASPFLRSEGQAPKYPDLAFKIDLGLYVVAVLLSFTSNREKLKRHFSDSDVRIFSFWSKSFILVLGPARFALTYFNIVDPIIDSTLIGLTMFPILLIKRKVNPQSS